MITCRSASSSRFFFQLKIDETWKIVSKVATWFELLLDWIWIWTQLEDNQLSVCRWLLKRVVLFWTNSCRLLWRLSKHVPVVAQLDCETTTLSYSLSYFFLFSENCCIKGRFRRLDSTTAWKIWWSATRSAAVASQTVYLFKVASALLLSLMLAATRCNQMQTDQR